MTRPIIGVDPSYTATGVAVNDHYLPFSICTTADMFDVERCAYIAEQILNNATREALVVIEAPSHASRFNGARLGMLHGVIRHELRKHCVRWLDVSPAQLKKYATGKGNSDKTAMVIAARERLGYDGQDDNIADALWLRQIGLALTGQPCAEVPKTHQAALDKLRPQLEEAA